MRVCPGEHEGCVGQVPCGGTGDDNKIRGEAFAVQVCAAKHEGRCGQLSRGGSVKGVQQKVLGLRLVQVCAGEHEAAVARYHAAGL